MRREDGGMRADHTVGSPGPDDRHLPDLVEGARSPGNQDLPECSVGDDPGVVVDPAVPFGLADHGYHAIGLQDAIIDQLGQLACVADVVQWNLAYFNGGRHLSFSLGEIDSSPAQTDGWPDIGRTPYPGHRTDKPPSGRNTSPVIAAAPGEAGNEYATAISGGLSTTFNGLSSRTAAVAPAGSANTSRPVPLAATAFSPVTIPPGATAFTRTSGAKAAARCLTTPSAACFAAVYAMPAPLPRTR